jgi:hypothetical protein
MDASEGTSRRHAYQHVREVCERYCERVGHGSGVGRPILWRLRNRAHGNQMEADLLRRRDFAHVAGIRVQAAVRS